jgi:hypothetical protein
MLTFRPVMIATFAALLLASCGEGAQGKAAGAHDLAGAAQANAQTALTQIEEQKATIEELQQQVPTLKSVRQVWRPLLLQAVNLLSASRARIDALEDAN